MAQQTMTSQFSWSFKIWVPSKKGLTEIKGGTD